ncbi:hypothetical protein CDAR_73361 [Caerostris darwini]|uniref:Uncharacterized protein n=1 Tax=Caerostris darwini TaxID=1538125 RepID=A0AAV4VKZ2_9ARAC|nr:hypothetical protein CDAR_73361 [Caerostris darwini]
METESEQQEEQHQMVGGLSREDAPEKGSRVFSVGKMLLKLWRSPSSSLTCRTFSSRASDIQLKTCGSDTSLHSTSFSSSDLLTSPIRRRRLHTSEGFSCRVAYGPSAWHMGEARSCKALN